jgi:hypothetical protein
MFSISDDEMTRNGINFEVLIAVVTGIVVF